MLRLGVISDLHVGNQAGISILRPPCRQDDDFFLQRLTTLVQEEQIKIDVLLIPGDITNRAEPEQMRCASHCIEQFATAFGVAKESVFAIPGNHDVDWDVLKLGFNDVAGTPDPLRVEQRYDPFNRQNGLLREILNRAKGSLASAPFVCGWRSNETLIIGVNTASHDDPKRFHHGLVTDEQISEVRKITKDLGNNSKYKILMIHHHPVRTTFKLRPELDFSELQYADRLLDAIADLQFHLIVHGHKHFPRIIGHLAKGARYIPIVGAGTFGAKIDYQYTDCLGNMFHVIDLEVTHAHMEADGFVKSWAFTPTYGWRKSDITMHSLAHRVPFGPKFIESKLKEDLEKGIAQLKAQNPQEKIITLENLIALPGLKHMSEISVEDIRALLDAMSAQFGWKVMGPSTGSVAVVL